MAGRVSIENTRIVIEGDSDSVDIGLSDTTVVNIGSVASITIEGGFAVELINDTGVNSVKGTIVQAGTSSDDAFEVEAADGVEAIGVVYDDGVADGSPCRVVVAGRVKVLLKNGTAATGGNWVQTSDVAGRADALLASPNPPTHFAEIGHCLETAVGGTDVLVSCMLHFN